MPTSAQVQRGKKEGILRFDLHFARAETDEGRFSRAELVFVGVDHSTISYEVRVFLNNANADERTPRLLEEGYAGRFVIFAHGGCYGGVGHCDVPTGPRSPYDLRLPHPLTQQTKIVNITKALERVLANEPYRLDTVTLVPVAKGPQKRRRGLTADLFKFDKMELCTYAHATASELGINVGYD